MVGQAVAFVGQQFLRIMEGLRAPDDLLNLLNQSRFLHAPNPQILRRTRKNPYGSFPEQSTGTE